MADSSGYWKYLGESNPPESPRILTRAEKNQALTHLEMDFNLASIIYTASVSEAEPYPDNATDRDKKRCDEIEGMYVTCSYAPILNPEGDESVKNKDFTLKIQPSTDDILNKVAGETIPGDLEVAGNLTASCLQVNDAAEFLKDVQVGQNLYINGDLYINGVAFGNLSKPEYNSLKDPNYAEKYRRYGTQDTGSLEATIANLQFRISQLEQLMGLNG